MSFYSFLKNLNSQSVQQIVFINCIHFEVQNCYYDSHYLEIVDVKSKVIEDMGLSIKAGPDSLIFTHCLPLCVSLLGAGPDSRPVSTLIILFAFS